MYFICSFSFASSAPSSHHHHLLLPLSLSTQLYKRRAVPSTVINVVCSLNSKESLSADAVDAHITCLTPTPTTTRRGIILSGLEKRKRRRHTVWDPSMMAGRTSAFASLKSRCESITRAAGLRASQGLTITGRIYENMRKTVSLLLLSCLYVQNNFLNNNRMTGLQWNKSRRHENESWDRVVSFPFFLSRSHHQRLSIFFFASTFTLLSFLLLFIHIHNVSVRQGNGGLYLFMHNTVLIVHPLSSLLCLRKSCRPLDTLLPLIISCIPSLHFRCLFSTSIPQENSLCRTRWLMAYRTGGIRPYLS